ncbi:MAG: PQQ-binding-like beta-propeller repeat protein [Planctomycetes bacterium]|nr:PQQ-binding-like beta-propeller repeat protein [Planctomycetota bacterium]
MSDRSQPQRLVSIAVLLVVFGLRCLALAADGAPRDSIEDSDLRTITDLLRGFSDVELNEARKAIPRRPDPSPGAARPRLVTVSGNVYQDRNANGTRQSDEPGLADVVVTDGEHVVRTPPDGGYRLRIRIGQDAHHRFVVLTRPTGYRPTGEFSLRIPSDDGRTDYSLDFGLAPDAASASREFWFVTASDSQFTTIEQMIPTAKDYAQITSAPGQPAFMTTAGDLTMSGSPFEWDMYDRIRRSSQLPMYEGFGGHDGNSLDPRSTVSFEQRIGPPYYSWDYGGVHFVQFVTETSYLGSQAQERQHDWLRADLQALPPKTPVIVVTHRPLDAAWFDERRAEGINVVCQIAAHWHVVQAGSRHGTPVLITAPARGRDWGAFSRTYRWVYVSPNGIRSRLRVAGQYQRLRIVSPGPHAVLGRQPLVVLAYDTARLVESVVCRWTSPDGTARTTRLRQQGDWSWHGAFEPDAPGRWTCMLEATDVAGSTWKRIQTVDVQPGRQPVAKPGEDFPWILSGEPPRRIPHGPETPLLPLWVTHTGSVHVLHGSPVVADGRVFVSVGNPNAGTPGAGVLCLDAATGVPIWKATSPLGDIRGPVSVHNDVVYAVTGEGWVAAYAAATGRALWSKPLEAAYAHGRPLAINNTPPVPTRFGLLVSDWQKPQWLLDYSTGEQRALVEGDVGHYASFATVFDDVIYCVRRGGGVALRLPGGEPVWTIEESSRSTSAPTVVDGKLIYGGSSGIRVRDASTGSLIWQAGLANAGYQNAIPVVWDDQVLVNGEDFRALDLETGKTRWTIDCASEADRFLRSRRQAMAGSSTPMVAGDLAWFGHDDTSIRAVSRDGHVVWEHVVGTPIKTAPVVTGNLLLVHDYAGNLWCFAGAQRKRVLEEP